MKSVLLMSLFMATVFAASAQKEVVLEEVTVKGATTVQHAEGLWIYPSRQQLEHSTNGYLLLSKLTLPHLRVDPVQHTVTALSNLGAVQVRINDMVATQEDLLALDVKAVQHIEYIDNPGVRYGEGTAYVVNIVVKRATSGHVLGADLTNTLTTVNGKESVFGKFNRGKRELGLHYTIGYQNFRGTDYDEQATYEMAAGDIRSIHRQQLEGQNKRLYHNGQLTYSLSDSSYLFQGKLTARRDIKPQRDYTKMAVNGQVSDDQSATRGLSPALDLYFHRRFTRHQSLTANAVGTFIKTNSDAEQNEGAPYSYTVAGRTASLFTETIYENRLEPFALSAGLQYNQKYVHNVYAGSTNAINDIRSSGFYLFGQLKGNLGRVTYIGGLGASNYYNRQDNRGYRFWLFRPKLTVAYPLTERLKAKYDFEVSQHVSQIALVSDVSIKQNAWETLVGNPDIHPNRVTSHDLRLTYSTPRLTTELQGYYRLNAHCNMERYDRQDGHFFKTQTNADNTCSFFFVQSYNQWNIVPDRLTATLYGGIYRFFNFTDDYRHTYTAFNGGASLEAYLGHWTLTAYADNGWNFMEGEHRGHQPATWYLSASYQLRQLTVSLYAQHPFSAHPLGNKTEILSRYIHKEVVTHERDRGNMLTLVLSWNFSAGSRYRSFQRTINHQDQDTGILQGR